MPPPLWVQLTVLAATSLSLAACDKHDEPSAKDIFIADEAACVKQFGDAAKDSCGVAFATARIDHAREAPKFENGERCHAETGSECKVSDEDGLASPLMSGVIIGSLAAAKSEMRGVIPVYAGRPPIACPDGQAPNGDGKCVPLQPRGGNTGMSQVYFWNSGGYVAQAPTGVRANGGEVALSSRGNAAVAMALYSFTLDHSGGSAVRGFPVRFSSGANSASGTPRGGVGATGRGFSSSTG